jgi:carboxyl-terminal processing protease
VSRFALLLLVPLALVAGLWLGGHPDVLPGAARDAFVADDGRKVLDAAFDRIEEDYYRPVDRDDLVDAAVKGAVRSLGDQFSGYLSPREYAAYQEADRGRFSGVGLAVGPHPRGLLVTRVYDGSPAARAGIRVDDVIVAADGRALRGLSQQASVALIKGPPGSRVRLTSVRDGRRSERTVTRATVSVPLVETRLREAGGRRVAVVALDAFGSGAHAEVYEAVRRARREGAQGLVLDLRGNPGGLLKEAQLVASAFIGEGPIVRTRGRSVEPTTLDAIGDPVARDLPMVVLVDRGSASAAEIVAGALQDRERAPVVGVPTFGKGVFQELVTLPNGGALDLTVGQYFTPDGTNLGRGGEQGRGIVPDVRAADREDTEVDEGLRTALRVLGDRLA